MPAPARLQDMDFEIRFYEGLIDKKPDFFEALSLLGDMYTRRGLYAKGLEMDERLVRLRPRDPTALYNLACSYSLLGQTAKALAAVKEAVECGYDDFDHLARDSDLRNLREAPAFARFWSKLVKASLKD